MCVHFCVGHGWMVWWVLHQHTYIYICHMHVYVRCICVCVYMYITYACTQHVCVHLCLSEVHALQLSLVLTVDVNDNERPQGDAGHGGQLPTDQSHNLVNLAVALLKVVLQSALLDGLCHSSGPVHGADGNDNLQTDRQTDRQGMCNHRISQQTSNGRSQWQ